MASDDAQELTSNEICPYLHQLNMDWLSMEAGGFYCRGDSNRTKTIHDGDLFALCGYPNFASCSGYRRLEETRTQTAR